MATASHAARRSSRCCCATTTTRSASIPCRPACPGGQEPRRDLARVAAASVSAGAPLVLARARLPLQCSAAPRLQPPRSARSSPLVAVLHAPSVPSDLGRAARRDRTTSSCRASCSRSSRRAGAATRARRADAARIASRPDRVARGQPRRVCVPTWRVRRTGRAVNQRGNVFARALGHRGMLAEPARTRASSCSCRATCSCNRSRTAHARATLRPDVTVLDRGTHDVRVVRASRARAASRICRRWAASQRVRCATAARWTAGRSRAAIRGGPCSPRTRRAPRAAGEIVAVRPVAPGSPAFRGDARGLPHAAGCASRRGPLLRAFRARATCSGSTASRAASVRVAFVG